MDGSANLRDREALRAHRQALHQFAGRAADAARSAEAGLQAAIAAAEKKLAECLANLDRARRQLQEAQASLEACLSMPRANCSGQAQAVRRAEAEVRSCEAKVTTAEHCRAQLVDEAAAFRRELARFSQILAEDVAAAAATIGRLATAADAYVGSPLTGVASGGSGSAGRGGGSDLGAAGGGAAAETIGDTDLVEVDLDRVDLSHSNVKGPASFSKVDQETMRKGMQRLDETVLPAVRSGADREYFAGLDRAQGLDYEHGYERVYDAFFGDYSLRLDARSDGSFAVTDGYHRIHVARQLGLPSLPARVSPWRPR